MTTGPVIIYRFTDETRTALAQFAETLVDIAAQGDAPTPEQIVGAIENILDSGLYEEPYDDPTMSPTIERAMDGDR